jgi:hypothetical protein
MAHQVEAEGIDLVVHRPGQHRVDHQLLHHVELGGGVLTAGAGLDAAAVVQTMVVAGHDAVQHRMVALAAGVGVVIDHVDGQPQPHLVQRLHHLAELHDALRAVGIGAVAALRHGVVPRVIAPVEGIQIDGLLQQRLLLLRIRRHRRPARRRSAPATQPCSR